MVKPFLPLRSNFRKKVSRILATACVLDPRRSIGRIRTTALKSVFSEKKKKRESFISSRAIPLRRALTRFRARSLARIPNHDPPKENAKGVNRVKRHIVISPREGGTMPRWEEGSRESRRILLPLYDDLDELRNAVDPQKLPRRITACHRGAVKFVERVIRGLAIVSFRFRAKCTIPSVGMSRKRRR